MKTRLTLLSIMASSLLSSGCGKATEGASAPVGSPPASAAQSINALGLELLAQGTTADTNALLSPYSIQAALAMTFAGAAGDTRAEMAKVLHYSGDEAELHQSFAALQKALEDVAARSTKRAESARQRGATMDPVILTVANRLFGQEGYEFRAPFLALAQDTYGAPLQPMDFVREAAAATKEINAWVEEKTIRRIRDLIPPNGLDAETRLVLVNAIYLKAPWAEPFSESATKPAPFHVRGTQPQDVPTMVRKARFGYADREGFTVVTIPYSGGELQFVVLLPDDNNGLAALEAKVTPELLAACADPGSAELILHLPKFKIEPPLFKLGKVLQSLGMRSAFDRPRGSANFDRMAPRKPNDYLCISEVFHKTFLDLDEKGTEAAAATAVVMTRVTSAMPDRVKPIEVRVDHPFLFAIQHRPTGACLFLGRVTDPRVRH